MTIKKHKLKDLKIPSLIKDDYKQTKKQDIYYESYEYWKALQSTLKEDGYNPEKYADGYIKCTSGGSMTDGNHRAMVLLDMYGGDLEIDVKHITKSYYILCMAVAVLGKIATPFASKKSHYANDGKMIVEWKGKEYTIFQIVKATLKIVLLIPLALLIHIVGKIGLLLGIKSKRIEMYNKMRNYDEKPRKNK